jgi:pimeloyl-ACP methyl ester carboxylesterase
MAIVLSDLIYENWKEVHHRLGVMGFAMLGEPISHAGSQCMVVRNKTVAYLVFRGTEASKGSISDILSNVGHPRRWAGQGLAHSGYDRHFAMIRAKARDRAELVDPETPLHVTGHSLGGVLATMYAAWVGSGGPDDHKIESLITFGAPKALSKAAVATIKAPGYRYTNRYDFAPHWQPGLVLGHPERQVKVNSGGWIGSVSRHGSSKYIKAVSEAPVRYLGGNKDERE